jgi:hypothetical protein
MLNPQSTQVWDRLADATKPVESAKLMLAVITLGHVHSEELVALTPHFSRIEQLVLDIEPQGSLVAHRPELNRAVDAASADWVLIVRERETISDPLASEIAAAAVGGKARGFRIRSIPLYEGRPLRIGSAEGELRLFHRRYFLRRGEMAVQGTVVRLASAFESVTFASTREHEAHLAERASRRSALGRLATFVGYVASTRTLDRATLRYLWIEAAYS